MGYDYNYTYKLLFPKKDEQKVVDILREIDVKLDGDFVPGVVSTDDRGKSLLCMVYTGDEDRDADLYHVWDMGSIAGYSRDINLVNPLMEIIEILKENGVLVSGYVFTSWDSVDYWFDVWAYGEWAGTYDFEKIGEAFTDLAKVGELEHLFKDMED